MEIQKPKIFKIETPSDFVTEVHENAEKYEIREKRFKDAEE